MVQETGERNYHAFYHLLSCGDEPLLRRLRLTSGPEHFHYTNQTGVYTLPGRPSEAEMWNELQEAFRKLAFSEQEIFGVSATLACILHVGNINFEAKDSNDGSGGGKDESDASRIEEGTSKLSLEALQDLLGW